MARPHVGTILQQCRAICVAFGCFVFATGCNTMNGPAVIEINSIDYSKAFETCIEVSRSAGMPPQAADRTTGIIETEPRTIGSWVEPWRFDSTGAMQKVENTTQFQRRRVRFVFTPKDWQPESIFGGALWKGSSSLLRGAPRFFVVLGLSRPNSHCVLGCWLRLAAWFAQLPRSRD